MFATPSFYKHKCVVVSLMLLARLIKRQDEVFRGFDRQKSIAIPLTVWSASISPAHRSRKSEYHCRHRPPRHQKGDLTSRECTKVLAADKVGSRSGRKVATSIWIVISLCMLALATAIASQCNLDICFGSVCNSCR